MGLKENIERARQQLLHEREIKLQAEQQKADEIRKNLEFLNQKASRLAVPYLNAIKQSGCVSIFNELIQMEKLVKERGGSTSAECSIGITFDCKPKDQYNDPSIARGNVVLENNTVHIVPGKSSNITDLLGVHGCYVELSWDEYEYEKGWYSESHTETARERILVLFKKGLGGLIAQVHWRQKSIIIEPKDLNKDTMEKAIAGFYVHST